MSLSTPVTSGTHDKKGKICSICRTQGCLLHISVCTSGETCHGLTSAEHKLVYLVTPERNIQLKLSWAITLNVKLRWPFTWGGHFQELKPKFCFIKHMVTPCSKCFIRVKVNFKETLWTSHWEIYVSVLNYPGMG